MRLLITLAFLLSSVSFSQDASDIFAEDDLNIGSDIFQDFNEDLEAAKVIEDERFYKYSRYFGVNIGLGFTTFTDNRGLAYEDNHPSFSFSYQFFMDFQNAFVLGIEFSSHTMILDSFTIGSESEQIGLVQTEMLRPFIGFRYYLDTTDLGTALTYSNPYFVGRVEYWYQTNEFKENPSIDNQAGGGIGVGVGGGLEFPIEIKSTYLNVEFLYHRVAFFDKFTQDYRQIPPGEEGPDQQPSTNGFTDLRGDVITIMINYNISW